MSLIMWGENMDEQVQEQPQALDLQTQFDALTQEKISLWNEIKDMTLYELTEQWKKIREIDATLLQLRKQIEGGH